MVDVLPTVVGDNGPEEAKGVVIVSPSGQPTNVATWPYDFDNIETVAIGGSSAQSGAINATGVELYCDVLCHVHFGADPTAVAGSSKPLPPGVDKAFDFTPGDKIAVIQASETGTLTITPRSH